MATKQRTERHVDEGLPLTAEGWPHRMGLAPDPSTWETTGPLGTVLWRHCRFTTEDGMSGVLILDATGKHPDVLFDVQGLPPPAEGCGELQWPRRHPEGAPDLHLMVRWARAYVRHSLVFGELAWIGGSQGQDRIINPTLTRTRPNDLVLADRALRRLLNCLDPRGRRDGDGATWAGGNPDFLDDLWTTLEKLTRETGTPWGHDPVSKQFRSKMRQAPVSDWTVRDWLREAGLRPRDIKSGNVTRANYSQFVPK